MPLPATPAIRRAFCVYGFVTPSGRHSQRAGRNGVQLSERKRGRDWERRLQPARRLSLLPPHHLGFVSLAWIVTVGDAMSHHRSSHRAFASVVALLLVALALLPGCGSDSGSTPAAPASPPSVASPPARTPPPTPPSVQGLTITTSPFDPRGYAVSETIGVQLTFSQAVTVSGSPRLKLGVGEDVRDALLDEEGSDGAFVAFRYVVTLEDRDEDGISIGADALDASGGAIRNTNGVDADLGIGDHAIADDGDHLVLGGATTQACGDQRSLARQHTGVVVREWDGTPFRVDIVRNFPDLVSDDYLLGELDAVGRLAEQIETQLGYRILERGDLIDVPARARDSWDQDFDRYWRDDLLPREGGQLLAFYLNDDNAAWGGEGSPMSAHICCGTTSYNRRFFRAPHWTEWTGPNSPQGEAIVHEVFHLLGFKHYYDQHELIGVQMSPGGLDRPWLTGSQIYYTTWTDIENLRCIFPEGG